MDKVNPFEKTTGVDWLQKPWPIAIMFSFALAFGHLIGTKGIVVAIALIVFPLVIGFLVYLFLKPKIGVPIIIGFSFFVKKETSLRDLFLPVCGFRPNIRQSNKQQNRIHCDWNSFM